ncbi:hypothetical protein RCL1_009152 [Eukaryota sp. TZLM3-RCL]
MRRINPNHLTRVPLVCPFICIIALCFSLYFRYNFANAALFLALLQSIYNIVLVRFPKTSKISTVFILAMAVSSFFVLFLSLFSLRFSWVLSSLVHYSMLLLSLLIPYYVTRVLNPNQYSLFTEQPREKRRHCLCTILHFVFLFLFLVLTFLFVFQASRDVFFTLSHKPPGQFFTTSTGISVHVVCYGDTSNTYTVVVDGGMGSPATAFLPIMNALPSFSFCFYDRPGLGYSPFSSSHDGSSFSSGKVLAEVIPLLAAPGCVYADYFTNSKLVLASHSIGGAVDRVVYGSIRLDGAILFDATTHHCLDREYALSRHNYTGAFLTNDVYGFLFTSISRPLGSLLSGFGMVSWFSSGAWSKHEYGREIGGFYTTEKHQRAWARELATYTQHHLSLISSYLDDKRPGEDDLHILGDMPVLVFSAGRSLEDETDDILYWGALLQQDQLGLSTNSQQYRCVDCDHFIMSWNASFCAPKILETFV